MLFLIKEKRIAISMILATLSLSPIFPAISQQIRDIADDAVAIQEYTSYKDIPAQQTVLKGDVTELEAIVGKSRMIRFDEPARRISIANPALADIVIISPTEILINGKGAGATSLIVWGNESDPAFFDLKIKNDSEAFLKAVKDVIPDKNINFEFTEKGVILSGMVSSSIKKEKISSLAKAYGFEILDLAESPTPQVAIEVKVAEVSRSFTRTLGTNFSKGPKAGAYATAASSTASNGVVMLDFNSTNGMDYIFHSPNNQFATELTAAVTKGLVKILAEPRLITTNGTEASFNAGQEVPVPSSVGMGGNVSYDFKKVGVIMTIKPKILEELNRISLDISPEVSEIDTQASVGDVFGFKTRKVKTNVELLNGQTLILAGLIKHTDNNTNTIVPGLGDIPIIGHFFRASTLLKNDTELMIFVTPKIIQPEEKSDRV